MGSTRPPVPREEEGFPPHNPDTLFFGCVDARLPVAKLDLPMGTALIHRNIAALVKPANPDVEATLEFAIKAKKIKRIVVGGHTNCGGIGACVDQLQEYPAVLNYLKPLEQERQEVARLHDGDIITQKREMEKKAIVRSLENLRSYDVVREAEARGDLSLQGWLIDIRTGKRLQLNEQTGEFIPLSPPLPRRSEQPYEPGR